MQHLPSIKLYVYKRYLGFLDTCSFYIAVVQNPVLFRLPFVFARIEALWRLVAGRALDREGELCTMFICIVADSLFYHCFLIWHFPRRASWHFVGWLNILL